MKNKIRRLTKELFPELRAIRHHLHMHPELSFEEAETSLFIREKLAEWGIPFKYGLCKHGVVGLIKGKNPRKVIGLRADMDALPIKEENEVPYKSRVDGVMHACGHDVHTTCMLGAAYVLNVLKNQINGSVKLIFQPGEEKLPGGASIMIKEGVLEQPKVRTIVGQHVHPPLPAGMVGFRKGQYMASGDEIFITIRGIGGHAALPNDVVDPVMISAYVLTALQTVVSRHSDPKIPTVLSFGRIFSSGGATNIIPDTVYIEGTLRTMDESNRQRLNKAIRTIVSATAKAHGGTSRVKIKKGYPSLYNDPVFTAQCIKAAQEYLGRDNVVELDKRMTAEDFSYYSQTLPSCFYRLGTGNPSIGINSPVHTPTFDIDEDALSVGAGLMAYLAMDALS